MALTIKNPEGTHKPTNGSCGGAVKDASCKGCGSDVVTPKEVKTK